MSRPVLLFVSPRFLFPLDEGGKIRTTGILRAMKGGAFEIVLASPLPPHAAAHTADVATICDRFVSWQARPMSKLRRGLSLAGSLPASVATDRSVSGRGVVARELAASPAVVVVDFPHAGVLAPGKLPVPSVMFTHNVEAEIFERHAAVARGAWKIIWQREAAKMRRFEGDTLRRFDTVIAVSARDGRVLTERYGVADVAVIDTGVDLEFYRYHAPDEANETVIFSGSMDSRSNIDGIEFLMDEVWPLVARARPQARMLVVGRNPPPALVARAEKLRLPWRFSGFVDDIRPHVLAGCVSVIPLRVGSGTRLKVFEAMALGRPIISTMLGVEGLSVQAGEHFVAAETAQDFATQIVTLLDDPARRVQLAAAARRLLEEQFSWQRVGRQFEAICLRTARRNPLGFDAL